MGHRPYTEVDQGASPFTLILVFYYFWFLYWLWWFTAPMPVRVWCWGKGDFSRWNVHMALISSYRFCTRFIPDIWLSAPGVDASPRGNPSCLGINRNENSAPHHKCHYPPSPRRQRKSRNVSGADGRHPRQQHKHPLRLNLWGCTNRSIWS